MSLTNPRAFTAPPPPASPKESGIALKIVLTGEQADSTFLALFDKLCELSNNAAKTQGGWVDNPSAGEKLAIMHYQISQALQALRTGNHPSDKIPEFSSAELALADAIITIMDFAKNYNMRMGDALLARIKYYAALPAKTI